MAQWTVSGPQRLTLDEPVSRLDVRLISGRLNVVGTDGPARVEITEAGRKPLTVKCRNGTLSVLQEGPFKWPGLTWWLGEITRRSRVDVSIAVPQETAANLRLIDGSAVISGLVRDSEVNVTSGRVTLLGTEGRVRAKLISGSLEALGVAGELVMETISGELVVADAALHRLRGNTIAGSITCDVDNPAGSEIRLATTSGDITVRVRADSDLAVDLHTTAGRITSAFAGLPIESGPFGIKDMRGVLGAGAGKLWVNSTSGSVSLLARPAADFDEAELA
jgi:hypothetical protein